MGRSGNSSPDRSLSSPLTKARLIPPPFFVVDPASITRSGQRQLGVVVDYRHDVLLSSGIWESRRRRADVSRGKANGNDVRLRMNCRGYLRWRASIAGTTPRGLPALRR